MSDPCCANCKGSPPMMMCREHHNCLCHIERDLIAQKKHNATTYKDTTARTAIRNVMKGQKK